ncbi:alpha/beta fold hydrolase [Haloarchaeobius amylolyticus]|uniref:alpha/beta fold hydrolase n=1 Tax=Haloarchaeobius amylolyticus TaxID=1198296 RepID=UPI0022718DB5|nr:alpha/beta hydrolase [Haloarchaeobius amylolyticus]
MQERSAAPAGTAPPTSDAPQTVTLADGRTLAFAEYGDPDGEPVLAFHGLPGSRHFGGFLADTAAAAGLRVVVPDRPGYGESSPKRDRTLADWADDVVDLADHLGFESFAVCGFSAGGPHALAVAAESDRVSRAAIVAGMAPPAADIDASRFIQVMATLSRRTPRLLGLIFRAQAWLMNRQDDEAFLSFVTDQPIGDVSVHGSRTVEAVLATEYRAAFDHGPAGAVADSRAVHSSWDIRYGDISCPVRGWYGTADENVPIETAQWLSGAVPDARIERVADEDHLSVLVESRGDVCSWLSG